MFRSAGGRWSLKVPKHSTVSSEVLESFCREKIFLEYLNKRNLVGIVPEYLEAFDVEPHCAARLFISENIGGYVLSELSTGEGSVIAKTPVVRPLVARMITIMKALHDNGVAHRGMHSGNRKRKQPFENFFSDFFRASFMRRIVVVIQGLIGLALGTDQTSKLEQQLSVWSTGGCPPDSFVLKKERRVVHRGPVIAIGGMGLVYRSTDGLLALKVPKPNADLEEAAESLRQERTILEYIQSSRRIEFMPKIYPVDPRSVSSDCALYLIVTDLVGPFPLQYVMSTSRGLFAHRKKDFQKIAMRLVEMVAGLYAIGVSHDDLHASNIVFANLDDIAGTLKIIDFGKAKRFSEIPLEDRWKDFDSVMEVICNLSKDDFGNPNPQIRAIANSIDPFEHPSPPFREVIARLCALDTRPAPIIAVTGIGVSGTDQEKIKWSEVGRLREALNTRMSLRAHFQLAQKLNQLEVEDAFTQRAEEGFVINGEIVQFLRGSIGNLSTDESFTYIVSWDSEYEENMAVKRLTEIFRKNRIPSSFVLPDGWREGEDLTVDAIMLRRNLLAAVSPVSKTWNMSRMNVLQAAARMAIRLIHLLQSMHDIGLVKGLLPPWEILVDSDDDFDNLVFKPNGYARIFVSNDGLVLSQTMGNCRKTNGSHNLEISPALLTGSCPGRFDDLYMVSEILLWFIAGKRPFKFSQTATELIEAKRAWFVHSAPNVLNDFKAEMFMRSESLDSSRPDYEGWIEQFELSL
jgi:serine/threonine protein kinase